MSPVPLAPDSMTTTHRQRHNTPRHAIGMGTATTISAADEDIQEGQLVVLLLLHRNFNVREDGVEMFFECQHLIPFDPVRVFHRISLELLLREKYDEMENRLGHAQIIQLLKFCLKTYFTFDGTIYEQVRGTSMGSPISGLIAEAVLLRLESLVFLHHRPKLRARYEDDTFDVIEMDQVLTSRYQIPFCDIP
nr:unnamed protein product [Spirometra erinaceieuropaei]